MSDGQNKTRKCDRVELLDRDADSFACRTDAVQCPEEVNPGTPGIVVTTVDTGAFLRLKTMKPEAKPKPVNNVDLAKGMWIGLARKTQWRCLIAVTHFAEAAGGKGRMTRTRFFHRDDRIFARAGRLWRVSDEWGPVVTCETSRGKTEGKVVMK